MLSMSLVVLSLLFTIVLANNCPLQFTSACNASTQCGALNGFPLHCETYGSLQQCACNASDAAVCQNTSSKTNRVPQFGVCSSANPCADSTGFVALMSPNQFMCAEPLACVPEISTATDPQSICHTCSTCKAQNPIDALGRRRFNCSAICAPDQITVPDMPITTAPTISVANTTNATTAAPRSNPRPVTANGVRLDALATLGLALVVALVAL
ncbi:Aste57867_8198 [Aphanomyces stellatus]|uniref:Aste57867_8198 protein n=1 Tax=Aphanomyces stellatus TaxID=120398 RepID=A0A485KJN7_9STRA|nr:hypothetical protein As57867_008167 [Aphanomyces stellatus]VFT85085.1 Aste57867_8198 [Aphanomyces stellatus]